MGVKSIATRRKYANSTIGKLKHENEKLRSALREIASLARYHDADGCGQVAREALGERM